MKDLLETPEAPEITSEHIVGKVEELQDQYGLKGEALGSALLEELEKRSDTDPEAQATLLAFAMQSMMADAIISLVKKIVMKYQGAIPRIDLVIPLAFANAIYEMECNVPQPGMTFHLREVIAALLSQKETTERLQSVKNEYNHLVNLVREAKKEGKSEAEIMQILDRAREEFQHSLHRETVN